MYIMYVRRTGLIVWFLLNDCTLGKPYAIRLLDLLHSKTYERHY